MTHVHRWILPPPSGPTVTGTCMECGATRDFQNSLPVKPITPVISKAALDEWNDRIRTAKALNSGGMR